MNLMKDSRDYSLRRDIFFYVFLTIFALMAWSITSPLMIAVIWAALLAFIVSPIDARLRRVFRFRNREFPSVSAALTLLLALLVIIVPLLVIFASLGKEIPAMIERVADFLEKINLTTNPSDYIPSWIPAWLAALLNDFLGDTASAQASLSGAAQLALTAMTNFSRTLVRGLSAFFLELLVALMTAFFFIRDGEKIMDYIKSITPLDNDEKERFYLRAKNLLDCVVFGIVFTVAVQAVLGALGWWFAGLGSPVFSGLLMFVFGILPMGTSAVWVPGGIYLLATGDVKSGAALLLWGTLIVSTVDNLLRPFVISGCGEKISTLLIILGLFGGVIAWGFVGVFLGPVALVLFTLVLDIYRSRWLKK